MRKELLTLMALGVAFASCDPGAATTVYFENNTDQEVIFHAFGIPGKYSDLVSFDELSIEPYSRVEVGVYAGLFDCLASDASYLLSRNTDSIRIAFDDCCLIYYRDSVSVQPHSPYSEVSFHLENNKTHWSYYTADAVYVITDEDYARAK